MNKHNSDVKKILLFDNEFRELCEKEAGQEIRVYGLTLLRAFEQAPAPQGRRKRKRHPHECLKGYN